MQVIANSVLLVKRLRELERRRHEMRERMEGLQRRLPEWAIEPLRLVGLSRLEIQALDVAADNDDSDEARQALEDQIEQIDREIESVENELLRTGTANLEGAQAVLNVAFERLTGMIPTDPSDLLYDYGEARAVKLLKRAVEDLDQISDRAMQRAS